MHYNDMIKFTLLRIILVKEIIFRIITYRFYKYNSHIQYN